MKLTDPSLLLLSSLLLLFLVGAQVNASIYFEDSSNWPTRVTVADALNQPDVLGETRKIRSGTTGILQRIEGGKALVDFGRLGVHWIDPAETDFESSASRIKSGLDRKEFPNAMIQLGNKIVQYTERDATHVLLEDIRSKGYFLCVYVNEISVENARIIQFLDKAFNEGIFDRYNVFPVVFPGENHWYGYFYSSFNRLPVFIPHMRLSYAAALWHEPNVTPSFVLIDVNGKIMYRSDTLSLSESRFGRRLSGHASASEYRFLVRELEKAFSAIK